MTKLALHLLGTPEVKRGGEAVNGFRSAKARALLFYVAVSAQPESRAKLAGLLWGNLPEDNANANLRKTLTNLRKLVGSHLAITRDAVAVDQANPVWLDVHEFEAGVGSGDPAHLESAVELYRGDFLDGFYVRNAPDFETWLLTERYRLREKLLLALHKLAKHYAGRRQYPLAIRHAQHLLALEPLREDVHRLLILLFARDGQRARALAQYEACAQVLAQELEVEPAEETTALYEQIRDDNFTPPLPAAVAPRHNLPAPTTSFVGREDELARIERSLAEPTDRLVTIVGPGGAGKTRLALRAAWNAVNDFADGAWVVSLASLENISNLSILIAATLGITFFGKVDPQAQVIRYLRRRELLLVLDNAEHLLSQTFADFLLEILTQAPTVKIVVTSRERLAMQAERVLDLSGLAYPDEDKVDIAASGYPAGNLFLQRAEGHGRSLPAGPEMDEAVYQLCRLVDGLPLALELAATWTPRMALADILTAIRRGLDFLATHMRDIPPRHRTIRAVFDTSWEMLDADERRIMRQLAYFRGGFSADAVASVVGASTEQLQSLVNKSLIRAQDEGRFDMHELIRHYAAGKLARHADEAEAIARDHGRYFANFLAEREEVIKGVDYLQAKAEIDAEAENVRQAWEWAVATRALEDVDRSAETLHYYFLNTKGLFGEAAERFQSAATQIAGDGGGDEQGPLVGRLLLKAAVNRRMLAQLDQASRLATESLSIFYRHELALDIVRATSTLGVIRLQQNKKGEALRLAEAAVQQARELDAPIDLCLCLNNLAYVFAHNEKHEAAVAILEESAALAQDIAYPHGALSAMNMLGVYYQQAGETERAEAIFEELVHRCRETATRSRLAQAVNNLGALYKKLGSPDKALPLLQEAVSLYEVVGQLHYAAFVTVMLGEIAVEQDRLELAQRHCRKALLAAEEMEMPTLALNALALFARLLISRGEGDKAVSIMAFVADHPATYEDMRDEVRRVLQMLPEVASSPGVGGGASVATLEDLIQEALRELSVNSSLMD